MRCKCKLFSVAGIPASDGSIIPRDVVEQYINSEKYRNDIASRNMLGTLTHRVRNLANAPASAGTALSKTIGKDDLMLMVDVAAPTHYIEKLYIESDGWCYADIKILDEEGFDDNAIQNIRRLKGLLKQGVKPGVSAIILGYWKNDSGSDYLTRLAGLKSLDITLSPSWKSAQVTEIYDDNDERLFSDTLTVNPEDYKFDGLKVKQFSDFNSLGCGDLPKSSKINGSFTILKGKQFSANGMVEELDYEDITSTSQPIEKSFSVTGLKERLKTASLSPRMRFHRLIIDYRQLIRQAGGIDKMDPETVKTLKSLFTSDVLDLMKSITPDIIAGKQINTLLGASSLGKGVRLASQKLQMPFRQAMQESAKQGFVSKARYQKIQEAYLDFIHALIDDIFSSGVAKTEEVTEEEK